jgi:AraC-like DNA-binding protein
MLKKGRKRQMFRSESELGSGIFDSTTLHKNASQTQPRTVARYELEIFHTDTGKSYMNGVGHAARRGMLLCAKPGAIRHSDLPVRCSFIRLDAEAAAREGLVPLLCSLPDYTYVESPEEADELIALFSKLASHTETGEDIAARVRANALLLDILYRFHRICTRSTAPIASRPVPDVVHTAHEYINAHFCEECSLHQIAAAVNLSPNHLHALYRRAFGETPYACVIRKRIDKAKKMIAAGQISMPDIAAETGFCSQSHFNKVFKAHAGLTPREFRNQFFEEY